jgi:hypothetical protein
LGKRERWVVTAGRSVPLKFGGIPTGGFMAWDWVATKSFDKGVWGYKFIHLESILIWSRLGIIPN